MNKNQNIAPFGLIFEEQVSQPEERVPLFYDEHSDISYVRCCDGRLVPYVEFSATAATATETRIAAEAPDTDDANPLRLAGTQTETKVWTETTDTDPSDDQGNPRAWFGTQTISEVRAESTDTDPGEDDARPPLYGSTDDRIISMEPWRMIPRALFGTDTFTKAKRESTDKD